MSWYERPYSSGPYRDGGGFFDNPMTWAPRIGRVAGIVIRIHILFILYLASVWIQSAFGAYELLFLFVLFGSVFLHELGHCFAARSVGGEAHEVLMWPLGGLAMVDAPRAPWPQFVTVVCGPLVNVVLFSLAWLAMHSSLFTEIPAWNPLGRFPDFGASWGSSRAWIWLTYSINLSLFLFNLLPMYPMDGGRMLHCALWKRLGYTKATAAASGIGMVVAVILGVYALVGPQMQWTLLAIAVMGYMICYQERLMIRAGGGTDDNAFGYDFSRGYTSLEGPRRREGWFARWRRRRAEERRKRRIESERNLQADVDRILDKVHQHGIQSLTRAEKQTLEEATRRERTRESDSSPAGRG